MFLPLDASAILSNITKHTASPTSDHHTRHLRKAKSNESFLTPLFRIVRNPAGTLGSILEGLQNEAAEEQAREAAERDSEKRILHFRLKTVGLHNTLSKHFAG